MVYRGHEPPARLWSVTETRERPARGPPLPEALGCTVALEGRQLGVTPLGPSGMPTAPIFVISHLLEALRCPSRGLPFFVL